jgi:ATP-dependent protease ClpP protease subunit
MKLLLSFLLLNLISFQAFALPEIVLNSNNAVSLNGTVDSASVASVMSELQRLDNNKLFKTPIYLVLNTPGGSIFDGLQLIQFARSLNRPVHTITIFSGSMGFQIVQNLGKRYATEFSEFMSHKARGSVSGEFPGQLDARYKHILGILETLDRMTVARTKGRQTLNSYRNLYENEYWATSFKAVYDGFADEVVRVKCDDSLKGTFDKDVSFGPFTVRLQFSKCPTITLPLDVAGNNSVNEKSKIKKLYQTFMRTTPLSF